mgnify:CR=1 FL=1
MSVGVPEIVAAIKEGNYEVGSLGDPSGFVHGPPFNEPRASPGGSSATFRHVSSDGENKAIRIPHSIMPGEETLSRLERMSDRVEELRRIDPSVRIAPFEIHREAVHFNSISAPAILMPWIEGVSLHTCAREAAMRGDKGTLRGLARRVEKLGVDLKKSGFDHGDVSGSNIIVTKDGDLWLIDPDTLRHYLEEDDDFYLREKGHESYAHPCRSGNKWEDDLFRFPLEVLIVSLRGLSMDPDLASRFGNDDNNLLFKREDFIDPDSSSLFGELRKLLGKRADRLAVACTRKSVRAANAIIGKLSGSREVPRGGVVLPESPLKMVAADIRAIRLGAKKLPMKIPGIMGGDS